MRSKSIEQIAFGGSCHWCTEAIFQSLLGVLKVEQGWVSSVEDVEYSEAVVVYFNPSIIALKTLIEIHLHTHSCTSQHPLRSKYRSAIYTHSESQLEETKLAMEIVQLDFDQPIITQVLSFKEFELNKQSYLDYYYSNPGKPFCKNVVKPKLSLLLAKFKRHVDEEKLSL